MSSDESESVDLDSKETTNTKTLYHYTTEVAAGLIQEGGMIIQSGADGDDDAAFGPGTYFTSMPPSEPTLDIAENNYDDSETFVKQQMEAGKIDHVIAVEFETDDPALEKCDTLRSVYLYKGDVDLDEHSHIIGDKHDVADEMNRQSGSVTM